MGRAHLEAFDDAHAETILTWVLAREDRDAWASDPDLELSPEVFHRWHADDDVHAYVLLEDGELRGYGEVWTDDDEGEAELAHVVVAHRHRGRGIGRRLVGLLIDRAAALGFGQTWVRVLPTNAAAIACYRAAGFVRATNDEEAGFNEQQPREYVWMRYDKSA